MFCAQVEQEDSGELQQNEKDAEESVAGAAVMEEAVAEVVAAKFSIQDVKEVLAELAHDMLGNLQVSHNALLPAGQWGRT